MNSQFPNDPYNQQIPPASYVPSSEYVPVSPYTPPPSEYGAANPCVQQQQVYGSANPYVPPPVYPLYGSSLQPEQGRGLALAGMILGVIGMVTWLLPCVGVPVTVTGLILSIIGRRSVSRKGMALAGIILSSIALALSLISSLLGVFLFYP